MQLSDLPDVLIDGVLERHVSATGLAALECTCRAFARRPPPAFRGVSSSDGLRRCEDAARRRVGVSGGDLAASFSRPDEQSWKQALRALECAAAAQRGQSIAAAQQHAVFASVNMRLFTVGVGLAVRDGRLGHGDEGLVPEQPLEVAAMRGQRVVSVSASASHTVCLSGGGQVFSCGVGDDGQLGHNDQHNAYTPRLCRALEATQVALVAAGSRHTCAVTAQGQLYSWGSGSFGRLGHGGEEHEFEPRLVEALQSVRVAVVAAGDNHTAAVDEHGALYTFGRGGYGRLGLKDVGRGYMELTPRPVEALASERVVHVAVGAYHTAAVTALGELFTCGRGECVRSR